MKKITVGFSYDIADVVKQIISDRTSSEWVDSHGRTGGHPATLSVTVADVMEYILDIIEGEIESSLSEEGSNFVVLDEEGNVLDEEMTLTDERGEVFV